LATWFVEVLGDSLRLADGSIARAVRTVLVDPVRVVAVVGPPFAALVDAAASRPETAGSA
jgi:hypothetical protein